MAEMTADGPGVPNTRRVIAAGLIGNVLEWYDFAVYGYFASVIGQHFFPSTDPTVSLIAAFGAFAAGFLVRPIGGLVFGAVGDLVGRRAALQISVLCMAVPTVLISVLPTYATIGILAPILIVALRITQGLSVGGEYTSSLVYLAEHAGIGRRAFLAGWGMVGAVGGILLGSAMGTVVTELLTPEEVAAWGWRVPFALGLMVAFTGILLRRGIHQEPVPSEPSMPLSKAFLTHGKTVLVVAGANIALGTSFYAAFVYSVTYIHSMSGLSEHMAFDINTAALAVMLFAVPAAAILSDKIGRKPMMIAGYGLMVVGSVPIYMLMDHPNPAWVFAGEAFLALAISIAAGGMVGANVELFPKSIRCTGLSFAYNAAIGIFGGTTPMVAAALIAEFGTPVAPGYWIAATGAVSLLFVLVFVRETAFSPLDDS